MYSQVQGHDTYLKVVFLRTSHQAHFRVASDMPLILFGSMLELNGAWLQYVKVPTWTYTDTEDLLQESTLALTFADDLLEIGMLATCGQLEVACCRASKCALQSAWWQESPAADEGFDSEVSEFMQMLDLRELRGPPEHREHRPLRVVLDSLIMPGAKPKAFSLDTGVSMSKITKLFMAELPVVDGLDMQIVDHGRLLPPSGPLKQYTSVGPTKVLSLCGRLRAGKPKRPREAW